MKQITLGNREITLVGSPMTPFYYKRAFKQSLTGDFLAMQGMEKDQSKFDDINILQMIWALENTYKMGKLKNFEDWLLDFEYFDLSQAMLEISEEIMNATFRETKDHLPKKSKESDTDKESEQE